MPGRRSRRSSSSGRLSQLLTLVNGAGEPMSTEQSAELWPLGAPNRGAASVCSAGRWDQPGTLLPEEGWRGREIYGLAKEESRVKGLGNGYF